MRSTYRIVAVFVAAMTALALGGCGGQQPESSEMSGQEQPAESSAVDTETPSTSEGDGDAAAEPEAATVGSSLDAYSWAELSEISNEIAAAPDQAVATASKYGLCAADGSLDGTQEKSITLADGTETAVQIIGFAHDAKSDGSVAGITFIFKNAIAEHPMNATDTNEGGWERSEMREYLDGQMTSLPSDLQQVIVEVKKKTNNAGETDSISAVTSTSDKLWLLSAIEVWGEDVGINFGSKVNPNLGYNMAKVFNEEGKQYQLFEYMQNAPDYERYDFYSKGGTKKWWLRSPYPVSDDDFKLGGSDDGNQAGADGNFTVVPCFCI